MSILIAKNNLHQNCLQTSTKKKKKLNLLQSQTNPNYSSKNPQNRSCDRLVQSVCSRYGPSLRQKLTTNIHQPNLTIANYSNLFSFTLLLSLSLSLSLYFCLSLKSLFPLIIQWSQCRFTETLCVLQVGASSRRRAMALRWRNRPTAAQRSRTMTWKVGPPRNPLSLLKKKKKENLFF